MNVKDKFYDSIRKVLLGEDLDEPRRSLLDDPNAEEVGSMSLSPSVTKNTLSINNFDRSYGEVSRSPARPIKWLEHIRKTAGPR